MADSEKMPEGQQITIQELENHDFESDSLRCKVAEMPSAMSKPIVGYALYYPAYSKWQARPMTLEDMYVRPSERKRGIGQRLFNSVAKEAVSSGTYRLEFHVPQTSPARSFFEARGAVCLTSSDVWCHYRLHGDKLRDAAGHT